MTSLFFCKITAGFKKVFCGKMVCLVVAMAFFLNSTAYGIPHITHLRKLLDFDSKNNIPARYNATLGDLASEQMVENDRKFIAEFKDSRVVEAVSDEQSKIVQYNLSQFFGNDFNYVLMGESIGGNAGQGYAWINMAMDKDGKIIEIGNIQDLSFETREKLEKGKFISIGVRVGVLGYKGKPYEIYWHSYLRSGVDQPSSIQRKIMQLTEERANKHGLPPLPEPQLRLIYAIVLAEGNLSKGIEILTEKIAIEEIDISVREVAYKYIEARKNYESARTRKEKKKTIFYKAIESLKKALRTEDREILLRYFDKSGTSVMKQIEIGIAHFFLQGIVDRVADRDMASWDGKEKISSVAGESESGLKSKIFLAIKGLLRDL